MSKNKETVSEKLSLQWKARMSLYAEGNKRRAEGDKLWAEAVIETHGNIKMEWKNWHKEKSSYECHLETGEVFIP